MIHLSPSPSASSPPALHQPTPAIFTPHTSVAAFIPPQTAAGSTAKRIIQQQSTSPSPSLPLASLRALLLELWVLGGGGAQALHWPGSLLRRLWGFMLPALGLAPAVINHPRLQGCYHYPDRRPITAFQEALREDREREAERRREKGSVCVCRCQPDSTDIFCDVCTTTLACVVFD